MHYDFYDTLYELHFSFIDGDLLAAQRPFLYWALVFGNGMGVLGASAFQGV